MRIILNNVLKVTLDIVENVCFFRMSSCERINYEFIYNLHIIGSETIHVLLENRASRASWNSILVDARASARSEKKHSQQYEE